MNHPFVEALYAVARRHLRVARLEEAASLDCLASFYEAGAVGQAARQLHVDHHGRRYEALQLALAARRKIRQLRAELERGRAA